VYGYFLPGATFLAILWVPFGLARGSWPSSDWTSALVAAALAYVLGHLIQSIATNAIPSREIKGPTGRNRYPSDFYLDSTDKELPEPAKRKIAELMRISFGLELQIDKSGDETVDKVRNNAFLFARQILIQGKAVSYAEQFQGMYALTRGLVSVLALGCLYWVGWASTAAQCRLRIETALILLAISLFGLMGISAASLWISMPTRRKLERGYALLLLIALFFIGYVLGLRWSVSPPQAGYLTFFAVLAFVGCLRAYLAYKFFAGRFASTVWRDYLAYNVKPTGGSKANPKNE
jgi:hypothetical protein